MKKYNCNIIVCGPGIGKTYLASIDDRFVDIDGRKSAYKYGLENLSIEEREHDKLKRWKALREDSKEYAIKLLEETVKSNRIALISFHEYLINYAIEKEYDYCLVYAGLDLAEEYAKRMRLRGNSEEFVNEMTSKKNWERFYKENSTDSKPKYRIELKKGKYLSDIKDYFI